MELYVLIKVENIDLGFGIWIYLRYGVSYSRIVVSYGNPWPLSPYSFSYRVNYIYKPIKAFLFLIIDKFKPIRKAYIKVVTANNLEKSKALIINSISIIVHLHPEVADLLLFAPLNCKKNPSRLPKGNALALKRGLIP